MPKGDDILIRKFILSGNGNLKNGYTMDIPFLFNAKNYENYSLKKNHLMPICLCEILKIYHYLIV